MSLFIASLNSGSNGNCYYVGNADEAVLVDAGISCKETEKRMGRIGLSMKAVKAMFISHEHTDHISGLAVLARKYQLPVYISTATLQNSRLMLEANQIRPFRDNDAIGVGSLSVTAFRKYHDAAEPFSFTVSSETVKVGVFTDLGRVCDNLIRHFRQCNAAFLEANFDEQMLENGRYPYFLKNRIRGGHGHLSNRQALDLFIAHKPAYMSHLLLAHLSKDNNNPELVQQLFEQHAGDTRVVVASRYGESDVYQVNGMQINPPVIKVGRKALLKTQLSLF